eukprot:CAMPEP_0168316628 /NCGR_PEP_ID=MMETSP0210-20121227/17540_1 /TAXON_ID=40633 /ORGANISM="Condylostoma magnum, Strain COL2" /LENGTH=76 /DNA_ID=CAMNT_0008301193 /DNA_START=592 /DNA_END=822 /DNA_ORIENTATION=-
MSKVFENAYTRVLSKELEGRGIRVNACCPGWTRTDMAGQNAEKSPEEGAETPLMLARSTGTETSQFWSNSCLQEWD